MLILGLGIAIISFILFLRLRINYPSSDGIWDVHSFFTLMSVLFGIIIVILILAICCLSTTVATENTIATKIEMYQQENKDIENKIDKTVKEYLNHEKDTFTNLQTEDNLMTLVSLFPELKSDTLISQELEIYISNSSKIKSLKEQEIDIAKTKWILYFGK